MLNGSLRLVLLSAGVACSLAGVGWGTYEHVDTSIDMVRKESYSRHEGKLMELRIDEIHTEQREGFKDVNMKLDVMLGVLPRAALQKGENNDSRIRNR